MQQVQDLFHLFFYSVPASVASPPHPRTPTRKGIPSNLSHLPSPLEEATFHSMMSDHRLRSAQKPRISQSLRVDIMATNPSDENYSFDEDFLTPQEGLEKSRRPNSFSPGEENKQPDSFSREEQLAAWKADRNRRLSGTLSKASHHSFRNATPRVNAASNSTNGSHVGMSTKPPLVQTQQQLTEKSLQQHSTNSKAMDQSHGSIRHEQRKPRYSIATFSSSVSGLPPKNVASSGRASQQKQSSNSKADAQLYREDHPNFPPLIPKSSQKQSMDHKTNHDHLYSTNASDVGCFNSLFQSPRSCSACDTSKCVGRRNSLPIRRSCSMVLFSKAENERNEFSSLSRMNSMPGHAKRRASIGTNPLERLSSKAAAQRMKERSSRNRSPSQMIVEILSCSFANDDIVAAASPLTCSVCSGSKFYNEENDERINDDDILKEFHIVVDDDQGDKYISNESHHSDNAVLLSDPLTDSDEICSTSHPISHLPKQKNQSLRSSSDLTDHELEEILGNKAMPAVGPTATHSLTVNDASATKGHDSDQAKNETDLETSIFPDVLLVSEEKLQPSNHSSDLLFPIGPVTKSERVQELLNDLLSDDAIESGSATLCKDKSSAVHQFADYVADSDVVKKVSELKVSSKDNEIIDEVLDCEIPKENVAEGPSVTGMADGACLTPNSIDHLSDHGIDDSEINECLVNAQESFGSFEEGLVKAYRGMKEEDVSQETVTKASYTIEDECPQLTSALLELEAFDWRNELISPVLVELPERRRTDVTQLFLPSANLSSSGDPSSQIESPPIETPVSQVSEVSFDWRKEIQSPLLQPRQKRRMRTSILSCIQSEGHPSPISTTHEDAICQDISLHETLQQEESKEESPIFAIISTPTKVPPRNDELLKSSTQKSPFHKRLPSPVPDDLPRKIPLDTLFLDDVGTASDCVLDINCHNELSTPAVVKEDVGLDAIFEAAEVIKNNGRSVLFTIPEDAADIQQAVSVEVKRLLTENRKFHDQVYEMRKSYDDRITPFRDLLDERRKLASEKALLAKERKEMAAELAEKQQRMNVTVQLSIEKVRFLQSKLNEARQGKEVLTGKIAELEQENERLKQEIEKQNSSRDGK